MACPWPHRFIHPLKFLGTKKDRIRSQIIVMWWRWLTLTHPHTFFPVGDDDDMIGERWWWLTSSLPGQNYFSHHLGQISHKGIRNLKMSFPSTTTQPVRKYYGKRPFFHGHIITLLSYHFLYDDSYSRFYWHDPFFLFSFLEKYRVQSVIIVLITIIGLALTLSSLYPFLRRYDPSPQSVSSILHKRTKEKKNFLQNIFAE